MADPGGISGRMMPRRTLLQSSIAAAVAAASSQAHAQTKTRRPAPAWFELRAYELRIGAQKKLLDEYLGQVELPELNKLGVRPIGVFDVMFGPRLPTTYVLLPYASPASFATTQAKLEFDAAFRKGAAAENFRAAPAAQPAFVRVDSVLLRAFDNMPTIEVPAAATHNQPRIFELRTYESASLEGHERKMEMFTKLGELEIFRRAGLTPVFFARNVIGPRLPSFTYLLTFPDLAAREKAWSTFRADPAWLELKATPGYVDADILSNVTDLVLRPTAYSQV